MKIFFRSLFIVLICFTGIEAQELPPVQNFAPADYAAENQNWAISQAADKRIFVANNEGLLVYNGAKWISYPSPNGSIMRSVYVDDNRIYTGCYMEFGYWEPDDFGILQYKSLSHSIKNQLVEDEEFWTILPVNGYLLFQSLNRIYVYNKSSATFSIIDSESRIPKVFAIGQQVYFQKMGQGLYKVENGDEILLHDDEPVQQDEIVSLFEIEENVILLTRNNGFYQMAGSSLEKWSTPDESLFDEISIYSALQMEDGHIALGTISNGLLILDDRGRVVYKIDEIKGLRNNTVLALFQDMDQNLWLGLDNGIAYVNLKSPFRVFRDNRGVVGSIYAAAVKEDILYLGTNQGLFYRNLHAQGEFQLIPGTQGQVWSLNMIDGTLFCGHHTGTFVVEGDRARRILQIPGTWKVGRIPGERGLLLQGNYDGLYVLSKSGDNWGLRNKIEGFDNSSRYFEAFKGEVFVNHEYKGVFRVKVDEQYRTASEVTTDTTLICHNSGMVKYQDQLIYGCSAGIFAYDFDTGTFSRDSLLSKAYTKDTYVSGKLNVDEGNDLLWVFTKSGIQYIAMDSFGNTPIINTIPLADKDRNGIMGYESVIAMPNETGNFLFGTSSGYLTADISYEDEGNFNVVIEGVKKGNGRTGFSGATTVNPNNTGEFDPEDNYVAFSFYVAEYSKYIRPKYQYQLLGMYPEWSAWSEEAMASFENLPYGDYTFKVRARIGNNLSANTATYEFRINRPWYLLNYMLVIYSIVGILLLLFIHRTYILYFRRQQKKLEKDNKREMKLLKLQKDREIVRLKNEQLKEDFKNKSNELAASTMSIIKKNELLTRVKEQLLESDSKENARQLIEIINRNLTHDDDWELFQEAFNNADREFLGKLKSVHPNLTPNDIRLCSYLRLNLSSKEIAQLLHISTRSVEIKRYRLRKKMDLNHDENLVNYILQL
ncbi:helix-turn-helix and ligand-binding sensor domain-containing protein [Lentiprolixibacter aurantiacus]|uniref:Triple tyrosine motif-containing protein n=1 Tax=Lentiprolixibacter aurantiacus TaxID=2993939 RepID=A0AAE3SP50_9FLAO|nr:triple tyrosine motif-containing protein [Lentiprolixibacter aurantiacus]MCX2719836.1 triple tyrosine motif-containing protein [Lentiprolixibacter aurantiacus]